MLRRQFQILPESMKGTAEQAGSPGELRHYSRVSRQRILSFLQDESGTTIIPISHIRVLKTKEIK